MLRVSSLVSSVSQDGCCHIHLNIPCRWALRMTGEEIWWVKTSTNQEMQHFLFLSYPDISDWASHAAKDWLQHSLSWWVSLFLMNYFSAKKLWGFGILTHGTCSQPKVVLCPEKFVNVLFKTAGSKGKAQKGCRPYKQSTRNQKRQNVSSVNSSDNG